MIIIRPYDRRAASEYARRWALERNPLFFDYTGIGGNCTNFVSQCVFAGSCQMNFTPVFGWYYLNESARTASWTGVEFFYNFIIENADVGPFGRVATSDELELGDVIQLARNEEGYYHSLLVVGFDGEDILVAAQTDNAYARPLSTYDYDYSRYIKILGVRLESPETTDACFERLMQG